MRSGRDPTRRNRNIGTRKSGRGQNNELVIPWRHDRWFHEVLENPVVIEGSTWDLNMTFLVEPPHPGFVYACTVEDVAHMLRLLPQEDIDAIDLIVFRQPTRKQRILSSVWGRLVEADIGRFSGTAVHLEAQNPSVPMDWGSKSIGPDGAKELDRLRGDGHLVRRVGRRWLIECTTESIRATQLYRTLPHEVGHSVDYERWYLKAFPDGFDNDEPLTEDYSAKPARDKEAFAHRYADETRARLRREGLLPFARMMDEIWAREAGLDPQWFGTAPVSR